MVRRQLRTQAVTLPSLEQLEVAIMFLSRHDAEVASTAAIEDAQSRKAARKALRGAYAEWEVAIAQSAGLEKEGVWALQRTARTVAQRRENLAHDFEQGGRDVPPFWSYRSPVDGLQRPFSALLNGRYFSTAQVLALDNGQLPNVLETAGGWCSRSGWTAWSDKPPRSLEWLKPGTDTLVEKANAAALAPWWEWAGEED
jgi:hypothetical protein